MAEINRKDIITDEALQAPLMLADNFEKAVMSANRLVEVTKKNEASIQSNSTSTSKLTKDTQALTTAQTELEKVQKQFTTSTQKLSDEYLSNKRALNAVNEEVRAKLQLGEKDAKQVTEYNSSLKQLEAALRANKQAYSELSSEHARNSKSGQELLKIINNQDKSYKDLKKSIGENQTEVGNYGLAIKGLKNQGVELAGSFKGVGSALKDLFSSGWGLAIVAVLAVVAAFKLLSDAANAYYTGSLKGEEQLQDEQRRTQAVMASYKGIWESFGESVAFSWNQLKLEWENFIFSVSSEETKNKIRNANQQIAMISEDINNLLKDHMRDVVDDSKTELEVTRLLEVAKDKLHHSDQERLKAARDAKLLLNRQLEGDLDLAKRDLETQKDQIALNAASKNGYYDRTKSLAEMTNEEILNTKAIKSELEKLRDLEIAFNKVETEAIQKRIAFNKIEGKTYEEIEADKKKAVKDRQEYEAAIEKKHMERFKKTQEDEKKFQDDLLKQWKDYEDEREKQAKKALDAVFENQADMDDKSLHEQLEYLEKVLESGEFFGDEQVELEKAIRKTKKAIREEDAKEQLEAEKELQDALKKLQAQAFNTGRDLINNFYDSQSIDADARRAKLEKDKAAEITAAGKDADAKAAIESKYAKKLNDLENEQRKIKRERAIADKAFSAFQIGVNTAKAVVEVLPNIPLSIIIGAIGALQLASVLTKPIPQFRFGTKSSPAGPAIVGEVGAELMRAPGEDWKLSPSSATMVNLAKGTEILSHEKTMKALALGSMSNESALTNENTMLQTAFHILNGTIETSNKRLEKAIDRSSGKLLRQGSLLYEVKELADGSKKRNRLKSFTQ